MTSRTYCKGKLFGTTSALEEIVPLKDGLSFRTQRFPSTQTSDKFIRMVASDARYIASHLVEILILVEELKAISIGTSEVIHTMSTT